MRSVGVVVALVLLGLLAYAAAVDLKDKKTPYNWRDLGASFNEKAGRVFNTGVLFRSDRTFNGKSCKEVGNPAVMYGFQEEPNAPTKDRTYCVKTDGSHLVDTVFTAGVELHDFGAHTVEYLQGNRSTTTMNVVGPECQYFSAVFANMVKHQSVLFHCASGTDRTGDFSIILGMAVEELKGINIDAAIAADYYKSPGTTVPPKSGHPEGLIKALRDVGGVLKFLDSACHLSRDSVAAAMSSWLA